MCSTYMCMHTNCIAPIRHRACRHIFFVVIVSSSLFSITRYYGQLGGGSGANPNSF